MDTDVLVIGAGVVGLAIAYKFAKEGHSVILTEKESQFGMGISSRNSEVIHAGIYYQTGSLKGSLCLRGKLLLYEHCKKYNIAHKKTGKIILAVSPGETSRLERTLIQANSNGLDDLVELDQRQLAQMEPELNGFAGLLSPSSGIVDSHGLMKSFLALAGRHDFAFAPLSPVVGAESIPDGWKVQIGGTEPTPITGKLIINAAGLYAIELSKQIFPERDVPVFHPTKGSYIRYTGKSHLNHIIYPAIIPGKIEERVDATPDLGGNLRFGPNVETPKSLEDFEMADDLVRRMLPGIQRYLPDIDTSRLHLDLAGIRPKIFGPGDAVEDFRFDWAEEGRWLDLWGMESPALTSSLAIAEHVSEQVRSKQILN